MTIFLSCMWNTKKAALSGCLFCRCLSKESETVFTTCIYNNIEYGHKMPHSIDTNS